MFKLALIISAVDRVTAPLRAINERIEKATEPARKLGNSLRALADEAGLGKVTSAFRGVGQAASNVWKEIKNVGVAMLGVVVAGYGLVRVVTGIANAGNELRNLSIRTKISVQTLAEYQYVAKQADISTQEWSGALDTLNRNLGQAKAGQGKLAALLQSVNPAFLMQIKHVKGNEQALDLLFKALTKLNDPNKRATLASAAFGKEVGGRMANLLENGTKGVEELREEFRALAGDQTEFANRSTAFDSAWKRFTTTLEGTRNTVFTQLLPAFTELLGVVQELVLKNKDKIVAWAKAFAQDLPQHIQTLTTMLKVMAAVMALKVVAAIGSLISSVATLGVVLATTPIGWVIAGLVAIAALIALIVYAWNTWGPAIKSAFEPMMEAIQELLDILEPVLMPILQAIGDIVGAVLVEVFKLLAFQIRAVGEGLKAVVGLFKTVGTFIGETAAKTVIAGGKAVDYVSSNTKEFFNSGSKDKAAVTVDFKNMPRGSRVTADPNNTADLDLSLGYTMVEVY